MCVFMFVCARFNYHMRWKDITWWIACKEKNVLYTADTNLAVLVLVSVSVKCSVLNVYDIVFMIWRLDQRWFNRNKHILMCRVILNRICFSRVLYNVFVWPLGACDSPNYACRVRTRLRRCKGVFLWVFLRVAFRGVGGGVSDLFGHHLSCSIAELNTVIVEIRWRSVRFCARREWVCVNCVCVCLRAVFVTSDEFRPPFVVSCG